VANFLLVVGHLPPVPYYNTSPAPLFEKAPAVLRQDVRSRANLSSGGEIPDGVRLYLTAAKGSRFCPSANSPHLPMGHPDDKKLRAAVRRNLYYEGYIPVNFL